MTIMKHIGLVILMIGLTFSSYSQKSKTAITTENKHESVEIKNLIRQVLNWTDSKNSFELLPVLTDSVDSVYVGFDLEEHKQNLEKLKSAGFFATEFIDNYNQIILTLDKGLRSGEYEVWLVGNLPPFIFANGASPWCICQDNMDWNTVEVDIISLDNEKGELEWYWENLDPETDESWEVFKYKFRVVKEDNIWKVAYMEGFDFKEGIRKSG